MKLYVDDTRPAPQGYLWAKTYAQACLLLGYGAYEIISLDYQLNERYTGCDVITFIAQNHCAVSRIHFHSHHPAGVTRMKDLTKRLLPNVTIIDD